MAILVIRKGAVGLGEFLLDGDLEGGGTIHPVLFFRSWPAAFFAGLSHDLHTAIVEAVCRESFEQYAIRNGHPLRIGRALDVVKKWLTAKKAVGFIEPRIIKDFEKIFAIFDHPRPVGEIRMERKEIVHRPEPGHIIGAAGVRVGPIFCHDRLVHLGNHFPRDINLLNHVRRRYFVA